MKKLFCITCIFLSAIYLSHSQELVRVLQPSMYSHLMAGQQLSDTTVRYFLTSKQSAYLSYGNSLMIDFDVTSYETLTHSILDTVEGELKRIEGSYKLFHLPLENGDAIIGSNGFECDITIVSLSYISKEGEIRWHLDNSTFFPIDFIDTIGFVAPDIVAVTGTNGLTHYFDFTGTELFYEHPPIVYYNIIPHNGFYFGTREDGVYKLNDQFEPVDIYPIFQPLSLHYVENDEFIVSTSDWSVLLNTSLNEVSINFSLNNVHSVARTTAFLWFITPEGLFQTTAALVIQKYYAAEPFEKMVHAFTSNDTVYVGSEYDGLMHFDFVIRKYTDASLPVSQTDISFTSLYIDTVTREFINSNWLQYTIDSIAIAIENKGIDTIKTFVINWDWRLFNSFCYSIHGEELFDSLRIVPGETQSFSFDIVFIQHVVDHLDPEFCFWVDFANQHTDSDPGDNAMCFLTSIVSQTKDINVDNPLTIFPNPAQDEIFIEFRNGKSIDYLSIYSMAGVLMHFESYSGTETKVKVGDLPPGIYFLKATVGKESEYMKFVKQ